MTKDEQEAVVWFRRAAYQGLADAQFILGLMYYQGEGVAKDEQEAVVWIRRAADQGLADAQFILGLMHLKGKGVAQDPKQAAAWLRRAASDVERIPFRAVSYGDRGG